MSPLAHTLPENFQADLTRAVAILQQAGCSAIFAFGSLVTGHFNADSDLDLAVVGCPPERFFQVVGQLMYTLEHSIDVVDLDTPNAFTNHLQQHGTLVRIG